MCMVTKYCCQCILSQEATGVDDPPKCWGENQDKGKHGIQETGDATQEKVKMKDGNPRVTAEP